VVRVIDAGAPTGPPDPDALAQAAEALRAGWVVGVPTDTVYGLAVDATRPGAARRVFVAKRRPRGVVLPVLVADQAQAEALVADVPEVARLLMARHWPGALTIVLPRRPGLALDLGDDGGTVGVRRPDHPVVAALARLVGPLATTSANLHGEPPATVAAAVAALPGAAEAGVALVLDAGECAGEPSTVVDCTTDPPRLLRAGAVPWPSHPPA
jgi:tRNA threonylcarbamoyl adenosine modification protein (Sua5/YciO/YrdC/YwlC family)